MNWLKRPIKRVFLFEKKPNAHATPSHVGLVAATRLFLWIHQHPRIILLSTGSMMHCVTWSGRLNWFVQRKPCRDDDCDASQPVRPCCGSELRGILIPCVLPEDDTPSVLRVYRWVPADPGVITYHMVCVHREGCGKPVCQAHMLVAAPGFIPLGADMDGVLSSCPTESSQFLGGLSPVWDRLRFRHSARCSN